MKKPIKNDNYLMSLEMYDIFYGSLVFLRTPTFILFLLSSFYRLLVFYSCNNEL